MAFATRELANDPMLGRYLAALRWHDSEDDPCESPGNDIRTCAACGEHTIFRLDPEGTWFVCSACGRYA
jgi:hypothetical protein